LTQNSQNLNKGVSAIPSKQANSANNFKPTFKKYGSMNEGEQAAFRQGAKTVENKVKGHLGFLPPKKTK